MKNKMLSIFRDSIPYVKHLNQYTKSVLATILMQQLDYWFEKYPDGFYKFLEPCSNKFYTTGQSWTEELGFSKDEFRTAFDKIGVRYKSKKEYRNYSNPFINSNGEAMYCSYHDKIKGLTYYFRNHQKVDNLLDELAKNKTSRKSGIPTSVNRESQFTEVDNANLRKSGIPTSVNWESQSRCINTKNTTDTTTENTFFSSTSDEVRLEGEDFSKKNEGTQDTPHQSLNYNTPNKKETETKNLVDDEYQAPTTIEKLMVLLEAKGCNGQSEDYAKEFFYHWNAKDWVVHESGSKMKNVDKFLNKFLEKKERKVHPAFAPIKNYFLDYYQETYQRSYKGFGAEDGAAINNIIIKLEDEIRQAKEKEGYIIDEISWENISQSFQFILTSHQVHWVKENLSPKIINLKFNDILNSIRNGKSNSNSNQRSNKGPKSDEQIARESYERVRRRHENAQNAV